MVWTASERTWFFGGDSDPGASGTVSDMSHPNGADGAVADRYCSSRLLARLRRGNIALATARCVIHQLTHLAPAADHTTPGLWTDSPEPLLACGRAMRACKIVG